MGFGEMQTFGIAHGSSVPNGSNRSTPHAGSTRRSRGPTRPTNRTGELTAGPTGGKLHGGPAGILENENARERLRMLKTYFDDLSADLARELRTNSRVLRYSQAVRTHKS